MLSGYEEVGRSSLFWSLRQGVNNPIIFLMFFEKACMGEKDCYAWTFNSELGNCLLSLTADVVQVIRSEHFESGLRPLLDQVKSWKCNFDKEDEKLEGIENEDNNDADAENVEHIKGEVQEEGQGEENIENQEDGFFEEGGSAGEGSEESQEEEEEWFNGSEVGGHESSRSNASDSSDDSVDYYDSTGTGALESKLTTQKIPTGSSSETESTSKSVTNDDLPNSAGTATFRSVEMSSYFTSTTTSEISSTRTTTTTMTTSKTVTTSKTIQATTTTNTATVMTKGSETITTTKATTKSVTTTTITTKMTVTDTSTTIATTGVTATTVTSKATNTSSKGTGNKSGDLIHCDLKIKVLFNHISMLCYILHHGPFIIPDTLHPIFLCISPT